MNGHRTWSKSAHALAGVVALCTAVSGCSIIDPPDSRPVAIDSIRVVLVDAAPSDSAVVNVYGKIGWRSCDKLKSVARSQRADSLIRTFVAEGGRGLCADSPGPLRYGERVARTPGRSVVFVAAQPNAVPVAVTIPGR